MRQKILYCTHQPIERKPASTRGPVKSPLSRSVLKATSVRVVYGGGSWPRRHGLPVTDWIYTMSALKKLLAAALISTMLSSWLFRYPTLEKDESARAIFDVENDQGDSTPWTHTTPPARTNTIPRPLSSPAKSALPNTGSITRCFVRTEGSGRRPGRGLAGIWNVEHAQKYGLHERDEFEYAGWSPPRHPIIRPGKDVSTECYQRAHNEMKQIGESPGGSTTYTRLETDARNAAGDRQLKKSLDDEWKRCVKDKGLTPDSEVTVKESKNIPSEHRRLRGRNSNRHHRGAVQSGCRPLAEALRPGGAVPEAARRQEPGCPGE